LAAVIIIIIIIRLSSFSSLSRRAALTVKAGIFGMHLAD
jgi:hypothetical protein